MQCQRQDIDHVQRKYGKGGITASERQEGNLWEKITPRFEGP